MSSSNFRRSSRCDYYKNLLESRNSKFLPFPIDQYDSESFDFQQVLEKNDFRDPFLVLGESRKFGIELPPREWKLSDVANVVGGDRKVRVIEVGTQSELNNFTLQQYAEYLERNSATNSNGVYRYAKVLNMISLEFSDSKLSDFVKEPKFVRAIDWVRCLWPIEKMNQNIYPRVQKYCLAGMAGSYTDFHIDFGGTSVWYHILWGKKIFYLIPPTYINLSKFQEWTCSPDQSEIFFGDLVEQCFAIELLPGQTLILPSGWIHSVYTPEDSLVFGGNFLHSYSIIRQLQSYEIEDRTRVDKIYMFPYFQHIHWHFLCGLLPIAQTFYAKRNYQVYTNYEKHKIRILDTMCSHLTLAGVFPQLPFLLKIVERWILETEIDSPEEKEYRLIADEVHLTVKDVIVGWWQLLKQILQANTNTNTVTTTDTAADSAESEKEPFTIRRQDSGKEYIASLHMNIPLLEKIEVFPDYVDILSEAQMHYFQSINALPTDNNNSDTLATAGKMKKPQEAPSVSSGLTLKIRKKNKPTDEEIEMKAKAKEEAFELDTKSGFIVLKASKNVPKLTLKKMELESGEEIENSPMGSATSVLTIPTKKKKPTTTTPTDTEETTSEGGTRRTRGKRLSKDYIESVTGLAVHQDDEKNTNATNAAGPSYEHLDDTYGVDDGSAASDENYDDDMDAYEVEEEEFRPSKSITASTTKRRKRKSQDDDDLPDDDFDELDELLTKKKGGGGAKKKVGKGKVDGEDAMMFHPVKKPSPVVSGSAKPAKSVNVRNQLLSKCKLGKRK